MLHEYISAPLQVCTPDTVTCFRSEVCHGIHERVELVEAVECSPLLKGQGHLEAVQVCRLSNVQQCCLDGVHTCKTDFVF